MAKNQCDGCIRGLPLVKGIHCERGKPVQTCTRDVYEPVGMKMHMISVNNQAVFVTLPDGERPRINGEDLFTIFGIDRGHCVKIG